MSMSFSLHLRGRAGVGASGADFSTILAPIPAFPRKGKEQDQDQHQKAPA